VKKIGLRKIEFDNGKIFTKFNGRVINTHFDEYSLRNYFALATMIYARKRVTNLTQNVE